METKVCTKCLIEKNLTSYYKEKLGKFGVRSVCKTCMKQISYDNLDLPALREKYKSNTEYRERKKEEVKKYAQYNKEKVRLNQYKWAKANAEKVKLQKRNCFYKHREKYKIRPRQAVRNLKNGYIISLIAQKLKVPRREILDRLSPELIKSQRELIKLKRAIRIYGKQ